MENQSLTDKRSCAYRTRGPALGLSESHKVELGSPFPPKVAAFPDPDAKLLKHHCREKAFLRMATLMYKWLRTS